jgi:hypothetical protein
MVGHVLYADRAHADQQQRRHSHRDEDRVDREPALVRPVDVAQMQDQSELIEDQREAEPEHGRGSGAPGE